ncbi:UNVERIFIED_ORG: Mg2+/citrate symporter [Peribacillus simplex]
MIIQKKLGDLDPKMDHILPAEQPPFIGEAFLWSTVALVKPLQGSIYILMGLLVIEIGDHIRFTAKYEVGIAIVMTIDGVLLGLLSI